MGAFLKFRTGAPVVIVAGGRITPFLPHYIGAPSVVIPPIVAGGRITPFLPHYIGAPSVVIPPAVPVSAGGSGESTFEEHPPARRPRKRYQYQSALTKRELLAFSGVSVSITVRGSGQIRVPAMSSEVGLRCFPRFQLSGLSAHAVYCRALLNDRHLIQALAEDEEWLLTGFDHLG